MSIIKLATKAIMIFALAKLSLLVTSLKCPKDILVQRGSTVSINCLLGEQANGKWYFGTPPNSSLIAEIVYAKILIRDYNIYDINEDASLVIKNVQHKQEGSYTIEHLKSDGTKERSTLALTIRAAIFKCREDMLVEKGSEVIISCGMEGKTDGKWYFGTTPYTTPIAEIVNGKTLIRTHDIYDINEDLSLVIKNIQHEQEGFYTIEHLKYDGTKARSTLALKIRAYSVQCPKEVTAAEGSALTVNCGLKQTTNVKWYRRTALGSNLIATMDGGTISITDDAVHGLTEDGSLIVKSLQNEHAGQYTIEHISSERIKERATVVVKTKVLQLDCPEELVVKRGNNLTINCGLGKKPSVRWYNGTRLSNLTLIAKFKDGNKSVTDDKVFGINQDASLIIKHIRPEQEGVYLVEHFMPDTSKESRTVAVTISGTLTRCPEKVSNKDGSIITINCHLDGISIVKWYFGTSPNCYPIAKTENGTISVADEQIYGINANGSLIVKDLRHEQEGFYTVEYYDTDGRKEQCTVALKLNGSILHCPNVVSDKEGSTVTINCHLEETSNVKWYFGPTTYSHPIAEIENGIKSVADEQLYDITSNATLIIKDLRHQQEGFYTVEYYNTYDGRTEQSTVVIKINEQTTHSQSLFTDGLATVEYYSFTERGGKSTALAKANDQTILAYLKNMFTKFMITVDETLKANILGWLTDLKNKRTVELAYQTYSSSFLRCSKVALFEEGSNTTISCGLKENSNVTWYFGTAPHSNGIATSENGIMSNELYGITKDGSLVIRNISHKQEGFYTVQLYTSDSTNSIDTIDVLIKASSLNCPEEVTAKEGSKVKIICDLKVNFDVKWYHGIALPSNVIARIEKGNISVADEDLYALTENSSLIVKHLRSEQEGVYTVVQSSMYGRMQSASIVVKKIDLSLHCPEELVVKYGSNLIISCILEKKGNVTWYFASATLSKRIATNEDGTRRVIDDRLYVFNEDYSLTINNVWQEMEGTYTIEYFAAHVTKKIKIITVKITASTLNCPRKVATEVGRNAVISCALAKMSNVTWYVGTAPHSNLIATVEGGTTQITDKHDYELTDDGSLIIKHIRHEQEGFYTVEYSYSDGGKEIRTVAVYIKENIFTASNLNCPKTVSAKEGSEAIIKCGLIKMSNVKWYMKTAPQCPVATIEGETIQITDNDLYALTEDGSLTIKHLRHEQEGSYYVEYVTPNGEKQTRMVDIYIRASFLTCRDTVLYEEGRRAIISCNLVGRNVKWYRGTHSSPIAQIENGTMLVANCEIYGITEDGSLIINHLRHEQEGSYHVKYVTPDGVKQTRMVDIYIRVSFLTCRDTVSFEEGRKAIISCYLVGRNVKWYRGSHSSPIAQIEDGTMSVANCEIYGITEDGSLIINHLRHEQEGVYTVKHVSSDGEMVTKAVTVKIEGHYSVMAPLVGILAIIHVIVYFLAWPNQPARSPKESGSNQNTEGKRLHPGKTSLMEAYNQNICPIPLPWAEYFLATDGEKKIIRHDQLNSNTNLYAETQVRITWPDGKTEQMSTLSFVKSEKSKTLRRVLFVGEIGCGKTSFVKQVSFLWSQMKTDEMFLFFLNLQNTNLHGNMAEEISKQLPEDCKIENIEFIIKNERCLLIFDGSNEFSDLNLKLGRTESGEQSYLMFQNLVKLAEVNINVRIWLTSRPCCPPQFRDSFAVVNFLSFKEDELKSYIKQMCFYYKTLKEQVQFQIKNFQELSSKTVVESHGNADVNATSRSVWSILEKNDILKLDADNLLMGIVIQLLVSSKYGIMNKHAVGIDLTSFPSIIKLLVKCLYERHVIVTEHLITTTATDNLELMIGRLFLKDDTLSIEQLQEEKRGITLLCGILKICPNSGNNPLDQDSTNTGYGFRCRHRFIQELFVAKYVSTDKQRLKNFRESSNKNDGGRKKRILMLIDNNYSTTK